MNVVIRGLQGAFAVLALAGVGLGLRWMTAGSIIGMSSYDLESMTVLAIGTIAWMAYGWLVLAVVLTLLEQLPGAIGALAGVISGRITSPAARTLIRSSLGVAAVTPLTVGVAHAAPDDGRPWLQVEPRSTVRLTEQTPAAPAQSIGRTGASNPHTTAAGRAPATDDPGVVRRRVAVPDRPASGAATRYTDLRSGVPGRVVVKDGDSLWGLAARELGPRASAAAVAARWPQWYAANRQVIGSDPDLLLPGQVLHIPAATTGHPVPPTHQEK